MSLEGLLMTVGVAVALAGSITLVWPVPRVWISNRRRAGLVLAAGLLITGVGFLAPHRCGCALPPIDPGMIGKR
jgi:hypothetical protein